MQGKTIIGYTLQRQLGVGGMAEVWYAENKIGKKAAVKLLLPKFCGDESIVARFENEAKVMVGLEHPNIRQVYDYDLMEGRPCIVMEYLEGDDLKALMKQGRQFTDAELRKWWNQIADALNYTHAEDIVHRDIKPSNLFLDKKGNIKLLDFGIAKIRESISMTQTGTRMGTLLYMSPEQVRDSKHIGPASDNYSLAVTFYHLLMGKAPYDSTTSDDYTIRKGIVEIPLDLSVVPTAWQNFLAPYLEKDPDKRPALRPFGTVNAAGFDNQQGGASDRQSAMNDDEGTIVDAPKSILKEPTSQTQKTVPSVDDKSVRRKRALFWGIFTAMVMFVLIKAGSNGIYSSDDSLVIAFVFLIAEGLLLLLVRWFRRLHHKSEAFQGTITIVTLVVLILTVFFTYFYIHWFVSLSMYPLLVLVSTAALFVITPKRLRILPYIVVVLMGLLDTVLLHQYDWFEYVHLFDDMGDDTAMLIISAIPSVFLFGVGVCNPLMDKKK